MRNNKRIAIYALSLVLVVFAVAGLVSCSIGKTECEHQWQEATCTAPKTCKLCSATEGEASAHTGGTATCTKKAVCSACGSEYGELNASGHNWVEATCTEAKHCADCSVTEGEPAGHTGGTATCTEKAVCSVCSAEYGELLAHSYTQETVKAEALKSAATCQSVAVYYKSCTCGAVSTNDADTFTSGQVLAHSYTLETVKAEALKSAANCQNAAIYYKSCICGAISTHAADTFESGTPADHVYDRDEVKAEALKSAASCESAAVYYKSCVCGLVGTSATFTSGQPLVHNYQEVGATKATCEAPATVTYRCTCGDEYKENIGDALGHSITGVTPVEEHVSGSSCEYVLIYTCSAKDCGKKVEGEHVYHHDYIASITKAATCKEDGEKTLRCACGATEKEPISKDSTGHNWVKGEVVDGVRKDTCSYCSETKNVTVYEGTKTDSTNANDLKDTEIELNDANISLDNGVIDTIGNKDVTISADKLEGDDRKNIGLTDDELKQVGKNPIYNFTINDGKDNISKFGDDNYVTITLPYVLQEGEDVDSIAIWFIDDEGKLESIKATYNNGYVTFKTNHFSYYTVTRLTPEERCDLYGCSYVIKSVVATCTRDGYDLYTCVRCHKSFTKNVVIADGHDYNVETQDATCTQAGYVLYDCKDCDHSYRNKINATGHNFEVEETVNSTCTANGYIKYGCTKCDAEYSDTIPKIPHVIADTVVAATCETGGYTLHKCGSCEYSYTDSITPALGHAYGSVEWTWANDHSYATATLTCQNNSEHKITQTASVTKTVTTGTCSNFVKTTYTATFTYNGVEYTDVKSTETGTPNHSFSSEWKHNDEQHWNECICGEKESVADHNFENATVTKAPTCATAGESTATCICGAVKVIAIPATGEHNYVDGVCLVCGEKETNDYYVNLLNSWKEIDGFAIRIENLSYEVKSKELSALEDWKLVGSIKQLDIAELTLHMKDGKLYGAARGDIVIFNGPIDDANAVYTFKALIEDGYIYINAAYGKDRADKVTKIKMSVEALLEELFGEMDLNIEDAEKLGAFCSDTVYPAIDSIIANDPEKANEIIGNFFNLMFTFEPQEDGTYVASLDYDKLLKLNEDLATRPVAEVVDIYFGEGAFASLEGLVREILDLKISDIPEYVKSKGVDTDKLIADINKFAADNGVPDFDLNEVLNDEEYASYTVGMLMFGAEDDSYVAEIDEAVELLKTETVYALCGVEDAEEVKQIKDTVAEIIDMISDSVSLSFTTNSKGTLSAIGVKADNFTYTDANDSLSVSLDVKITMNGDIDVTWRDIIDDIEDSIVKPSDSSLDNTINMDSYSTHMYMTYKGKDYECDVDVIRFLKPDYSHLLGIIIEKDCGGWMNYQAMYGYNYRGYQIRRLYSEENGNAEYILVVDDVTGETVEIELLNGTAVVIYEDGTQITLTGDQMSDPSAMYVAIFGDGGWEAYSGRAKTVYYYYNKSLDQYSDVSHHQLKVEYDVIGETCNDQGCIITETCTVCGDVSTYKSYGCNLESGVVIDLSEHSTCGGSITVTRCKICGNIDHMERSDINCNMDEGRTEDVLDGAGNVIGYKEIYTCKDCGLTFVNGEWRETTESPCEIIVAGGNFIYKGDQCIVDIGYRHWMSAHKYEYSYEMHGDTCDDGYTEIRYCTVCGESYRSNMGGHRTDYQTVELDQFGLCGGHAEISTCRICQKEFYAYFQDYECNWYHLETTEHGNKYQCRRCNTVRVIETVDGEKDENCTIVSTTSRVYSLNGEVVFSYSYESSRTEHDYEYSFSMSGDRCEDGYIVSAVCRQCNDSYEEERTDHSTFVVYSLNPAEVGCCAKHNVKVYCCPCEYSSYITLDRENFSGNDKYGTYVCDSCGLTVKERYNDAENGCSLTVTHEMSVTLAGKELYGKTTESVTAYHKYEDVELILNGDSTVIIANCSRCGKEKVAEIQAATLENHMGEFYYDLVFTPEESGTYTIESITDKDTVVSLYKQDNGSMVMVDRNDDGGRNSNFKLTARLVGGTTYVYRIAYLDGSNTGAINYVLSANNTGELSCDHGRDYMRVSKLLDGSKSCEDGTVYCEICVNCGYTRELYIATEHYTVEKRVDLSEYGACYGYMVVRSCACGRENDFTLYDSCAYHHTSNKYYDEEDRLIYVDVQTCPECDLRYTSSYYIINDIENCRDIYCYTGVINIGGELVFQTTYEEYYTAHDYEITYELLGGEGSSCEDGVLIERFCKTCKETYKETHYWHETFEKERIELSKYGSVCGGYAVIRSCPCGEQTYMDLEHNLCERAEEYCEPWVTNAIKPESQYTTNGYHWFDNSAYLITCAVTDPVERACGVKIRYSRYWVNEGGCMAYRYETWQFGYDEKTGTCMYEVTFKTGSAQPYHNYIYTNENNSDYYDCPDCGSYYHQEYKYTSNGELIKYHVLAESTLSGTVKKLEEINEYSYDSNGNRISRNYSRLVIKADGSVESEEREYMYYKKYDYITYSKTVDGDYWREYKYSYNFVDRCMRTLEYSDSRGEHWTEREEYCIHTRYDEVKAPTCTQDGEGYDRCVICGYQFELHEIQPLDHKWVYVSKDKYFCYECGLENENGASGSVVMEDLTDRYGEGKNYVVGYWDQKGVDFTYYVSLVFGDNSEIILEGVEFFELENVRAIAFSKASVEALASALGYSSDKYLVKFSFVPYGSDGSFDYGVTFTDTTDIGTISDNTSFKDHISEGETASYTIVPTVDGSWTIRVNHVEWAWTELYIYNSNNELVGESCGTNHYVRCALEAGETYTVTVRCEDKSFDGYIYVIFTAAGVKK